MKNLNYGISNRNFNYFLVKISTTSTTIITAATAPTVNDFVC